MRQNLKFEEKNVKWGILEQPLKEIYRIFKEGEGYVRQCMETKNWWAKAIVLYQNSDCVELYIHNLPSCIPVVIEAIEIAGEFSGLDHDEIQKKSLVYSNKYQQEWKDPRLFQWKFAKQYLISQELCNRYDRAWKEDRWMLLNKILEKKMSGSTKQEGQLTDILLKNLKGLDPVNGKLLPCSILLRSKDYQIKRRLGSGRTSAATSERPVAQESEFHFHYPSQLILSFKLPEEWNISTQRKSLGFYLAARITTLDNPVIVIAKASAHLWSENPGDLKVKVDDYYLQYYYLC
ncbi:hypothetical protein POTOM_010552 [Populus tomentosa]|uniref:DUF1221 domain-containing protein n=1 Tax=Populus tomentosa TaxID=118781 RepID=A0A8X8ADT4_POPTO|nr:hypothetical protein POTOM_010552 [Populus tomentosa]